MGSKFKALNKENKIFNKRNILTTASAVALALGFSGTAAAAASVANVVVQNNNVGTGDMNTGTNMDYYQVGGAGGSVVAQIDGRSIVYNATDKQIDFNVANQEYGILQNAALTFDAQISNGTTIVGIKLDGAKQDGKGVEFTFAAAGSKLTLGGAAINIPATPQHDAASVEAGGFENVLQITTANAGDALQVKGVVDLRNAFINSAANALTVNIDSGSLTLSDNVHVNGFADIAVGVAGAASLEFVKTQGGKDVLINGAAANQGINLTNDSFVTISTDIQSFTFKGAVGTGGISTTNANEGSAIFKGDGTKLPNNLLVFDGNIGEAVALKKIHLTDFAGVELKNSNAAMNVQAKDLIIENGSKLSLDQTNAIKITAALQGEVGDSADASGELAVDTTKVHKFIGNLGLQSDGKTVARLGTISLTTNDVFDVTTQNDIYLNKITTTKDSEGKITLNLDDKKTIYGLTVGAQDKALNEFKFVNAAAHTYTLDNTRIYAQTLDIGNGNSATIVLTNGSGLFADTKLGAAKVSNIQVKKGGDDAKPNWLSGILNNHTAAITLSFEEDGAELNVNPSNGTFDLQADTSFNKSGTLRFAKVVDGATAAALDQDITVTNAIKFNSADIANNSWVDTSYVGTDKTITFDNEFAAKDASVNLRTFNANHEGAKTNIFNNDAYLHAAELGDTTLEFTKGISIDSLKLKTAGKGNIRIISDQALGGKGQLYSTDNDGNIERFGSLIIDNGKTFTLAHEQGVIATNVTSDAVGSTAKISISNNAFARLGGDVGMLDTGAVDLVLGLKSSLSLDGNIKGSKITLNDNESVLSFKNEKAITIQASAFSNNHSLDEFYVDGANITLDAVKAYNGKLANKIIFSKDADKSAALDLSGLTDTAAVAQNIGAGLNVSTESTDESQSIVLPNTDQTLDNKSVVGSAEHRFGAVYIKQDKTLTVESANIFAGLKTKGNNSVLSLNVESDKFGNIGDKDQAFLSVFVNKNVKVKDLYSDNTLVGNNMILDIAGVAQGGDNSSLELSNGSTVIGRGDFDLTVKPTNAGNGTFHLAGEEVALKKVVGKEGDNVKRIKEFKLDDGSAVALGADVYTDTAKYTKNTFALSADRSFDALTSYSSTDSTYKVDGYTLSMSGKDLKLVNPTLIATVQPGDVERHGDMKFVTVDGGNDTKAKISGKIDLQIQPNTLDIFNNEATYTFFNKDEGSTVTFADDATAVVSNIGEKSFIKAGAEIKDNHVVVAMEQNVNDAIDALVRDGDIQAEYKSVMHETISASQSLQTAFNNLEQTLKTSGKSDKQVEDEFGAALERLGEQWTTAQNSMDPSNVSLSSFGMTAVENRVNVIAQSPAATTAVAEAYGVSAGEGEYDTRNGIWVSTSYDHARSKRIAGRSDYKLNQYGFAAGYDININDSMLLGLFAGYAHNKYKFQSRPSDKRKDEVFSAGLYSRYTFCSSWGLNAYGAYSNDKMKVQSTGIKDDGSYLQTHHSANIPIINVAMTVDKSFDLYEDILSLTGFLGAKWVNVGSYNFIQNKGTATEFRAKASDKNYFYGIAGLSLKSRFDINEDVILRPHVGINGQLTPNAKPANTKLTLISGNTPVTGLNKYSPKKFVYSGTIGCDADLYSQFRVGLTAHATRLDKKLMAYGGALTAKVWF